MAYIYDTTSIMMLIQSVFIPRRFRRKAKKGITIIIIINGGA